MAQILKRIVVAQRPNVLIEDLHPKDSNRGVFLRRVGDARDLLAPDATGKSFFTIEQVTASKSLDNLVKRGHLKLYDENGTELDNAAGGQAERATNLATLKDVDEATGTGGSGGHTIQDESSDLPQRTNLSFQGSNVTVTDDAANNRTIVTIADGAEVEEAQGPYFWTADGSTIYNLRDAGITNNASLDYIENSLEVFLNGQQLKRDVEYEEILDGSERYRFQFIDVGTTGLPKIPNSLEDLSVVYRETIGGFGGGGGSSAAFKTITIENPNDTEDLTFFFNRDTFYIEQVDIVLIGSSSPSITWTLRFDSDRSATGTEIITGGTTTTNTTSGETVTSFNNRTIPSDNYLWLETTATSGVVTQFSITVSGYYV